MNLLKLAPALENFALWFEGENVTADAARCVRHWNRDAACTLCVDACPTHAITLAPDGITLAQEACVQCGECVHGCPTGAFAGVNEGERLLRSAATLPPGASVEILCGHNPSQEAGPAVDALIQTGA